MENIKEIIAKNLVELRKEHKMTQQALAEMLNYTDKAISRWEHAETLPDIETLCRVCDIYGVKFEYLLQREQPKNKQKNPNIKNTRTASKVVITLTAISTVWLAITVLYTLLWSFKPWTLFIWAVPLTSLTLTICNQVFFGKKLFRIISLSFLLWSTLLGIYIELLRLMQDNIWMIFIIGIPIQAILILIENIKLRANED
jgi:transcriptional regulator with XRE-family HTH domain